MRGDRPRGTGSRGGREGAGSARQEGRCRGPARPRTAPPAARRARAFGRCASRGPPRAGAPLFQRVVGSSSVRVLRCQGLACPRRGSGATAWRAARRGDSRLRRAMAARTACESSGRERRRARRLLIACETPPVPLWRHALCRWFGRGRGQSPQTRPGARGAAGRPLPCRGRRRDGRVPGRATGNGVAARRSSSGASARRRRDRPGP